MATACMHLHPSDVESTGRQLREMCSGMSYIYSCFCLFHVNRSCVASDLFFGSLCTLLVLSHLGFAGGVVGGEERRGSLWGSRD